MRCAAGGGGLAVVPRGSRGAPGAPGRGPGRGAWDMPQAGRSYAWDMPPAGRSHARRAGEGKRGCVAGIQPKRGLMCFRAKGGGRRTGPDRSRGARARRRGGRCTYGRVTRGWAETCDACTAGSAKGNAKRGGKGKCVRIKRWLGEDPAGVVLLAAMPFCGVEGAGAGAAHGEGLRSGPVHTPPPAGRALAQVINLPAPRPRLPGGTRRPRRAAAKAQRRLRAQGAPAAACSARAGLPALCPELNSEATP
jgi:hypothetical protein